MRAIGAAAVFGVVVLFAFPMRIISTNLEELGQPEVLALYAVLALVGYLLLALVLAKVTGEKTLGWIVSGLFFLGVFVLLADVVAPLTIDQFESGTETPDEPFLSILLEAGLFVLVAAAFVFVPKAVVYRLGWPIAIVLVVVELGVAGTGFLGGRGVTTEARADAPSAASFSGNVYHIVVDGYHGPWFQDAVAEMGVESDFDGFQHFPRARSNYMATKASVPSFISGQVYPGETSVERWLDETFDESVLFRLKTAGFNTTGYTFKNSTANPYANRQYVGNPVSLELAADLWLMRIAPTFLRQEVFHDGRGPITRAAGNGVGAVSDLRTVASLNQFQQIMDNEFRRGDAGEYVFAHLNPPHRPYHVMRDGRFDPDNADFFEQSYHVTDLLAAYVRQLKQLGRFESSLIIFQSDHGSWLAGGKARKERPELDFITISDEDADAIEKADVRRENGVGIDARSNALLLIKPPFAPSEPVEVSDKLVQLLDIPKVVYALTGMSDEHAGESVETILERDRVDIYHGLTTQLDKNGDKLAVGRDLKAGHINHYSVDKDDNWTVHEDVPFKW